MVRRKRLWATATFDAVNRPMHPLLPSGGEGSMSPSGGTPCSGGWGICMPWVCAGAGGCVEGALVLLGCCCCCWWLGCCLGSGTLAQCKDHAAVCAHRRVGRARRPRRRIVPCRVSAGCKPAAAAASQAAAAAGGPRLEPLPPRGQAGRQPRRLLLLLLLLRCRVWVARVARARRADVAVYGVAPTGISLKFLHGIVVLVLTCQA
jgi:hypothetical protein